MHCFSLTPAVPSFCSVKTAVYFCFCAVALNCQVLFVSIPRYRPCIHTYRRHLLYLLSETNFSRWGDTVYLILDRLAALKFYCLLVEVLYSCVSEALAQVATTYSLFKETARCSLLRSMPLYFHWHRCHTCREAPGVLFNINFLLRPQFRPSTFFFFYSLYRIIFVGYKLSVTVPLVNSHSGLIQCLLNIMQALFFLFYCAKAVLFFTTFWVHFTSVMHLHSGRFYLNMTSATTNHYHYYYD